MAPPPADPAAAGFIPVRGRRQNTLQKAEAKGTIEQGLLGDRMKGHRDWMGLNSPIDETAIEA